MPKDSLFPSDEPVGYQVWHKQGQHYEHVASVESNALGAMMMTTHGFMGFARWQDNPRVAAMPGEHRSTTIGDVLIGHDGQSLEIAAEDGLRLKPIAPIDEIPFEWEGTLEEYHRQAYVKELPDEMETVARWHPPHEEGRSVGGESPELSYRIWQAHDPSAAAAGWSAFPQDYRPAIDVFAGSREQAYDWVKDGAWWEDSGVDIIAEGVRSTRQGDVIVGPDGQAHRITQDGFAEIDQAKARAATDEPPSDRAERQLRDWKQHHSAEFVPDPATGRIGPGTHRWEDDAWAAMSEAEKLRVAESVPDWSGVDDRAKEAILSKEVDFSRITRDELNAVYATIGPGRIDERPARRLFDNANFDRAERMPLAEQHLATARDTTRNLVESIMLDAWPRAGAIVDFGLDSQAHYEALYYPIRNGEIGPTVLDAALGHGAKLTLLARQSPSNPHKDIQFHTAWDSLLGRPAESEKPQTPNPDSHSRRPNTAPVMPTSTQRAQFQQRDNTKDLDR